MLQKRADGVRTSFLPTARALAPLVTAYYLTEVQGGAVTDRLHPEWGNIRFLLAAEQPWQVGEDAETLAVSPRLALFGATSRARTLRAGGGRCLGVGLTPLGWAMLVGADAAATADGLVPAEAVMGTDALDVFAALQAAPDDLERVGLLDRWLLARAAAAAPPRVDVAALTRLLADPATGSVAALAAAADLTPATLSRACLRHFGFTPKLLLRRQRFLRTLATVLETHGRLSESLDPHYVDQSHFNRDFHVFMGETPGRYFGRVHPILDAAAEARRAALGASVQGLHVGAEAPTWGR